MRNRIVLLVVGLVMVTASERFLSAAGMPPSQPRPPKPILCPDPMAKEIQFLVANRRMGRITIRGVVQNIGTKAYQSNPGQQVVCLYQNDTLVASRDFGNLPVGATAAVTFTRTFTAENLDIPPIYTLTILYDPDIRADGNRNNDDINWSNNSIQRDGSAIMDLLFH